ncbi:hypothetical protein LEP1GSC034_4122 [Leptospira interrogans str. 2003000735]|nr:hypothetical protein LEP1GSC034_4122 [Leptospira interrogans str. 2003000735]
MNDLLKIGVPTFLKQIGYHSKVLVLRMIRIPKILLLKGDLC